MAQFKNSLFSPIEPIKLSKTKQEIGLIFSAISKKNIKKNLSPLKGKIKRERERKNR